MEAVGNELWVLVGPNAKLLVVDPARRRAVRKPIPLPKSASSFVVDSGSVWANDLTKSEVTRIPRDGGDSVTAPVLAIPVRIAKGGDTIWTANQQSGAVTRLDATTLKLKDRPVPAGGQPSDVEVVDNTTWVSNFMDGTVTRIQAR
jgi:streptogramin lyase